MKLNYDCIRDIMLTIEEQETPMDMMPEEFYPLLPQYSELEINYCCKRLHEAGYLTIYMQTLPSGPTGIITRIGDLTFSGHEFLADIRPTSTWEKIAPAIHKLGAASFKTVSNVASAIGTEALKGIIN